MAGSGKILVENTSVREGETIKVDYSGEGPLMYSVDGEPAQELSIDPATGEGMVVAPAGAGFIVFFDADDVSAEASVEILPAQEAA